MMKKVLVTGAGGYIGSVATYLLLHKGYEIVAVDNFATGFRQPLELLQDKFGKDKLKVYEDDLQEDLTHIFKKEKDISAVMHYAASCIVDESMSSPEKYFENNILGTLNLVENLVDFKIPQLIFSSSCAVYGQAEYVPVDEKHPTRPTNPYGESKLMAEKIIEWFGKLKGIRYVILRYFNVCGATADGLIGDSKKPSTLLVQNAVRGALGIEPFQLTYQEFNTPDRSPIRDYINVVDLNEAHLNALEYLDRGGSSQLINLGTGSGNSVLEIVKKVETITGKQIELKKTTPREGEYDKMVASIAKAKELLGWEPKRTIDDSVNSLIAWYKTHPHGWDH